MQISHFRTPRMHVVLLLSALMLFFSLVALAVSPAQAASTATLTASSTISGRSPVLAGTGFTAAERVDIWLTTPDGKNINYSNVYAQNDGTFSNFTYDQIFYDSDGKVINGIPKQPLAAGTWYASARGTQSNVVAVSPFEVLPITLQIGKVTAGGNQITFQFAGTHYYGGEQVSLWVTDSAGKVTNLGYCWATGDGIIPAIGGNAVDSNGDLIPNTSQSLLTFAGQPGQYKVTAYGTISKQTVVADLKV